MTFEETWQYLMSRLPMYQRVGSAAVKKGLGNTLALCEYFGNPQEKYPTIHVAGTNGKGSSSHFLAACYQAAGYKVGLYTSPHLKRFTERIRVNGEEMPEQTVADFVSQHQDLIERIGPSFFEITVVMAFVYFAEQQVDIAIIETGLGGRLDSTNVLKKPLACLITNIGYDHTDLLGDTLPKIAAEKAGIIKPQVPVVISQTRDEVRHVFEQTAAQRGAPLYFADERLVITPQKNNALMVAYEGKTWLEGLSLGLHGAHQHKNWLGVLQTVRIVQETSGYAVNDAHLLRAAAEVVALTGLQGRWQQLQDNPRAFCDVGHNEDGIRIVLDLLQTQTAGRYWFVLGMVSDKDHTKMLRLFPADAQYIFCQPNVPRGFSAQQLAEKAEAVGRSGLVIPNVGQAYAYALAHAQPDDLIFVGGSTFVVAELPLPTP